jgi:MFS family permease
MTSPYDPLRHPVYRSLFCAQLVSNVGTWMQTVGAQWLMGDIGGSAFEVSLVQAAVTLPVFVVALPAGAAGDIVDRRRLLIASQSLMVVAAAGLAAVTFAGAASPWGLLALTFMLGVGQGLTLPSWQAIVPELVDRREIPLAAALAGVNANVGRAIGPALGGAVIAAGGPAWTFALNALSFVATVAVLVRWRRPPVQRPLGPEHIGAAIRTGRAYARHAPTLRALLARAALFVSFAGAIWALLPVYARSDLELNPGGYGLLLGVVGVGAAIGAVLLPRLRARVSNTRLLTVASVGVAGGCAACALTPSLWVVGPALVLVGAAWIAATSTLNGGVITVLPGWVRSRGTALYTLVFNGGQALSAIAWGLIAQLASTRIALAGIAAGLVLSPAIGRPLPAVQPDIAPEPWPVQPELAVEPDPDAGPVLVTVEFRVPTSRQSRFREAMQVVGRARRRTGAERWGLFQDAADPYRFMETFLVASWEEHLRQHQERATAGDRAALHDAIALAEAPPRVRHFLWTH